MQIEFILEKLAEIGKGIENLSEILMSDYAASYKLIRQNLYGSKNYKKLTAKEFRRKERQNFYCLLHYLQKEELVEKRKINKKSFWKITSKGIEKLKRLKVKNKNKLPKIVSKIESEDRLKIIIFDIPEREKRKRYWLRKNLSVMGFSMLQKSVWAGKNKLPAEFMNNLNNLSLLPYVEIFSINRVGTISRKI